MEIFICTQLLFLSKALWIRNEIYLAPALAGELMLSHLAAVRAVKLICHELPQEPWAKRGTSRGGTRQPRSIPERAEMLETWLGKTSGSVTGARAGQPGLPPEREWLHFVSVTEVDLYRSA